jgi:hypothetical protein
MNIAAKIMIFIVKMNMTSKLGAQNAECMSMVICIYRQRQQFVIFNSFQQCYMF